MCDIGTLEMRFVCDYMCTSRDMCSISGQPSKTSNQRLTF